MFPASTLFWQYFGSLLNGPMCLMDEKRDLTGVSRHFKQLLSGRLLKKLVERSSSFTTHSSTQGLANRKIGKVQKFDHIWGNFSQLERFLREIGIQPYLDNFLKLREFLDLQKNCSKLLYSPQIWSIRSNFFSFTFWGWWRNLLFILSNLGSTE